MSGLRRGDLALRELVQLGRVELILRLAILAAVACFVAVAAAAGSMAAWAAAIGILLGAVTMLVPDSEAGLVTVLFLVGVWYFAVQDSPWSLWTPVAALALLGFHVATSAAARAPVAGGLPRGSLGRWALRTAVVAIITVAAFAFGRVVAAVDAAGSLALTTLAGRVVTAALVAARRWAWAGPRGATGSSRAESADGRQADSLR